MMKLIYSFGLACLLFSFAACSNDDTVQEQTSENAECSVNVKLSLETGGAIAGFADKERLTRGESSVAPSRITLSIFDAQGQEVKSISQLKDDAQFGSFDKIRLSPGTYSFAVVANRASGTEDAAPTIASPSEATIPGEYVLDVWSAVKEVIIGSGNYTAQEVAIVVPLRVTKLRFAFLEAIPADAAQLRVTFNAGREACTDLTFNPTTGLLSRDVSFSRTFSLAGSVNKTNQVFCVFAFMDSSSKDCVAQVEALGASGEVRYARKVDNVTFNQGKVKRIELNMFTGLTSPAVTFDNWVEDDTLTVI